MELAAAFLSSMTGRMELFQMRWKMRGSLSLDAPISKSYLWARGTVACEANTREDEEAEWKGR